MVLTDHQVYIELFMALITGILAIRLGILLYD